MPRVVVKPYGPRDAKVLFLGEAPAGEEENQGQPFVGASGVQARFACKLAGIDDKADVRWLNTAWRGFGWPYKFPSGRAGAEVVQQWATEVDRELRAFTGDVIIACGGVALRRLTGFTSIDDWHSSVLRQDDLPDELVWYKSATKVISGINILKHAHSKAVIIPVLHPAGILKDPRKEKTPLFYRDIEKAGLYLSKNLRTYDMNLVLRPSPVMLWDAFADATEVYFDTEFNPETGHIYWIGLTCDGKTVYGMPWHPKYFTTLKEILENTCTVKGAHNFMADSNVMKVAGIDVKGPVWDTMIGMYCLTPGLNVGLSPTSRFLLDDVKHTKDMDKNDPVYNALDVLYGWHSRVAQLKMASQRPVDPMPQMLARMNLVRVAGMMENRGMLVDEMVQAELLLVEQGAIKQLEEKINRTVTEYWDIRVRKKRVELLKSEQACEKLKTQFKGLCETHPKFNGIYKPSKKCLVCQEIHKSPEVYAAIEKYDVLRSVVTKLRGYVKKWEEVGFNFKSPEHLKWLLYDPDGLGLPIQKDYKTRKLSSGAVAIERLAKLKQVTEDSAKFTIVDDIKTAQSHAKSLMFIKVPKDDEGWAHPPVKVHGTTTGRVAGGEDKKGEIEKVSIKHSFNAFNIP